VTRRPRQEKARGRTTSSHGSSTSWWTWRRPQKLGIAVASALAAATLLVIGLIFIAVAAIVYLSQLLGVALAFFLIGAVFLIGAGIFTSRKIKAMQR
jgi:hypothetical protein